MTDAVPPDSGSQSAQGRQPRCAALGRVQAEGPSVPEFVADEPFGTVDRRVQGICPRREHRRHDTAALDVEVPQADDPPTVEDRVAGQIAEAPSNEQVPQGRLHTMLVLRVHQPPGLPPVGDDGVEAGDQCVVRRRRRLETTPQRSRTAAGDAPARLPSRPCRVDHPARRVESSIEGG